MRKAIEQEQQAFNYQIYVQTIKSFASWIWNGRQKGKEPTFKILVKQSDDP